MEFARDAGERLREFVRGLIGHVRTVARCVECDAGNSGNLGTRDTGGDRAALAFQVRRLNTHVRRTAYSALRLGAHEVAKPTT